VNPADRLSAASRAQAFLLQVAMSFDELLHLRLSLRENGRSANTRKSVQDLPNAGRARLVVTIICLAILSGRVVSSFFSHRLASRAQGGVPVILHTLFHGERHEYFGMPPL
jgi:hypothetical protein